MTTVYYHGAREDFEKPKLNGQGFLWLTENPKVAQLYGAKYNKDPLGNLYLWQVTLGSNAKVVDIGDLSQSSIRALRDALDESYRYTLGPMVTTDEEWVRRADFTTLEARDWVRSFLRRKRVDGVTCKDVWHTSVLKHTSLALLNLKAISTLTKLVVPAGQVPTKNTMLELSEWIKTARRVDSRFSFRQ